MIKKTFIINIATNKNLYIVIILCVLNFLLILVIILIVVLIIEFNKAAINKVIASRNK